MADQEAPKRELSATTTPVETRLYSNVSAMVPVDGSWYELYQSQDGSVSLLPVVAWAMQFFSDPGAQGGTSYKAVGVRAPLTQPPDGFAFTGYVRGIDRAPLLDGAAKTWDDIYKDMLDLRVSARREAEAADSGAA